MKLSVIELAHPFMVTQGESILRMTTREGGHVSCGWDLTLGNTYVQAVHPRHGRFGVPLGNVKSFKEADKPEEKAKQK